MECRVNVAGGTPIRSCVKGKLQCFLMHNTYLLSLCSGSCPAQCESRVGTESVGQDMSKGTMCNM